jgi:hypothetical protein
MIHWLVASLPNAQCLQFLTKDGATLDNFSPYVLIATHKSFFVCANDTGEETKINANPFQMTKLASRHTHTHTHTHTRTHLLDVHESVHRDIIMKVTNKMQLCRLIYYS